MPGTRIPNLTAISGANTANDDNLVIFDTSENTTKRILRSQLAAGIVGDLPYTPAGFISATTVPTAIAEIASDVSASDGSSLVGFLQAGTGAVARTAQAKMRDTVSVKDFGAVGDGIADDTAAIQAAIDHAYSQRVIENAGAGLYVQEASIPVVNACGLALKLTTSLNIPPQCEIDLSGGMIDATSVSGYVFAQGTASGFWKFRLTGGVITHADSVFDLTNTNQAGGGILIDGTVFDDVTVQVANVVAQSTPVHFRNCRFLYVKKAATIQKCDFILFEDCVLRPTQGGMDTNEQVMFDNSGKLELRRLLANPGTITGSPVNIAWVANRYDAAVYAAGGRTGVFIARDCRWGGENGSMTVVNNYAAKQSTAAGTQVIVSGGEAFSANGTREASSGTRRCIIRLFDVPNILSAHDIDGVEAANLIDKATTTDLVGTQDVRITTFGCAGSNAGSSSYTGTFIPPELLAYANKDQVVFNITSNVNANHTVARGGTVTNTGTGAGVNIFTTLPPAKPGMEITYANTQSGSGYIQVQTQSSEVLVGGIVSGAIYYIRLNYNQQITVKCDIAGQWYLAKSFTLKGATSARPTLTSDTIGLLYLDTTLDADGKPIWWNGTAWVDATGATV